MAAGFDSGALDIDTNIMQVVHCISLLTEFCSTAMHFCIFVLLCFCIYFVFCIVYHR